MLRALVIILALTAVPALAQQAPGPVGGPEGPWRMQIHWVPLDISGTHYLLQARVCRPAGEAPARVVVIAHGSPPSAGARPGMTPLACDSEAARWFLEHGFVVIAAMRRGYGATGGYWVETYGKCPDADYARAGLESARDIAATVDYAATLPFARPQGIVLVGRWLGRDRLQFDAAPARHCHRQHGRRARRSPERCPQQQLPAGFAGRRGRPTRPRRDADAVDLRRERQLFRSEDCSCAIQRLLAKRRQGRIRAPRAFQ
jgi:hypothetical protein